MNHRIYLDHAATTPLRPEARAAMEEGARLWANPSSPHAEGRAARRALEDARERVKAALGWQGEVIFTSGASEALAIGLGRARAQRRLVSAVEHDAVFRAAPEAEVLPLVESGASGFGIDPALLRSALAENGRAVVAIQSRNSETGTDLLSECGAHVAEAVRNAGGILLADCSQSAGRAPLPEADMIVVSAHKLGGPVGVGALLVRDFGLLEAAGGQERGYRAGTENLAGVLGFAAALNVAEMAHWQTSAEERMGFRERLSEGGTVFGPGVQCSHIFAVTARSLSSAALLMRLDSMGFAVSAGSACSSGSLKPSRVLSAFELDGEAARHTIRVSLGWSTTAAELDSFADAWGSLAR